MKFIVDLCRFQQKMLWLLPWGPTLIDETGRYITHELPRHIRDMKRPSTRHLARDKFQSLVRDQCYLWDRVWSDFHSNFEFLAHVHRHPCEEIYLENSFDIQLRDLEHLASCRTLRSLHLQANLTLKNLTLAIKNIQNLEHLDVRGWNFGSVYCKLQLALYKRLPNLTSLKITRLDGQSEMSDAVQYIQKRRNTLQHVKIICPMKRRLAEALAECKHITTLQINYGNASVEEFEPLLTCKHLHQTLKLLDLSSLTNIRDFRFLQRFSSLRCLHLDITHVTNEDLAAVILRNAKHLVEVSVEYCESLTSTILKTFAHCACIKKVYLAGCHIEQRFFNAYVENRRQNYEALQMGSSDDDVSHDSTDDSSDESYDESIDVSHDDLSDDSGDDSSENFNDHSGDVLGH